MEKDKSADLSISYFSSIDDKSKFDLSHFKLMHQLGSGAFGKVYKVKESSTGEIFAAKISILPMNDIPDDMVRDLSQEVNIISKLNHPSVLKFIGYSSTNFKKKPKPVIVTEFAPCGSLQELIERSGQTINEIWTDTRKLIIIYGIASGMSYLHSNNILHRDLKPANILIDEFFLPKIADFGLSTIKQEIDPKSKKIKGTPIYISPEIWEKTEYTKAGDVYAFGIILYEIVTNDKPYGNCHYYEIMYRVNQGQRPEFKKEIPESYRSLIESCWAQEPINRPSFDEILDKLKNDKGFITEKIDKQEFLNCIKYIDKYNTTFDSDKNIINVDKLLKRRIIRNDNVDSIKIYPLNKINENSSSSEFGLFPFRDFMKLNDKCKQLVLEANDDPEKQFSIAKSLIEGLEYFPFNLQVGIKYLKHSFKQGNNEALKYYCKLLIKGNAIPTNLEKAKKIIQTKLIDNEALSLLLMGKIMKKEGKYDEAKQYFMQSIYFDNDEAYVEYGKMIYKGIGSEPDVDYGIDIFVRAAGKGNIKAFYKVGILMKNSNYFSDEEKQKYVKFIEAAANQGYPKALLYYSKMIEGGIDVPRDIEYAFNCKRLSAFLGSVEGMYQYALHCFKLRYKPISFEESKLFFKKASDKGYVDAMFKYALLLLESKEKSDIKEAINFIHYAAICGNSNAMFDYGFRLLKGYNIPIDVEEGMKYLKKAADCGNIFAMNMYGVSLLHRNKSPEDKEEAKKYFKLAADKGDPYGLQLYGSLLIDFADSEEGAKYIKMSALKGNIDAISKYAVLLLDGIGVPADKNQAIMFFQIGIKNGSTETMYTYGKLLIEGKKVPMNKEEGIRLIKMAADKGNCKAMNDYALMLSHGQYVPMNKEEGAKYMKMAADKNYLPSISNYVYMLANGIGIPANKELALRYIKIAINKGSATAMRIYGTMLENGVGVPANKKEAAKYYKMAFEKGDIEGQILYAKLLYKGEGVPINKEEAIKYFKIAIEKYNSIDAMLNYGYLLANEDDSDKKKEGLKYVKQAADLGYLEAIHVYARLLNNGIENAEDQKEIAELFKEGSDKNDPESLYNYGRMLFNGEGFEVDKKKAFLYFQRAADLGHLNSLNNCAVMLIQGNGIEKNIEEGLKLLKEAADKGLIEAITNYGIILTKGEIIEQNKEEGLKLVKFSAENGDSSAMLFYAINIMNEDKEEAIKFMKISADKGNIDAMLEYANALLNNKKNAHDIDEALQYLNKAAEKGHLLSINYLAALYGKGLFFPIDRKEYVKYIKMGADHGDVESMLIYGSIMLNGEEGIQGNIEEGLKYIKMSADNGNANGMNNYAFMLENGIGTQVNIDEACRYYKMAIKNGSFEAMYSYGLMLIMGDVVQQNVEEGFKYIKTAAENGNHFALFYYGQMHERGICVPVDKQKAMLYYKMSAEKGVEKAKSALFRLIKELAE